MSGGVALMMDGLSPYVPGVNCIDCGRFVGRDGHIVIEHREMSNEIAGIDGTCGKCLRPRHTSPLQDSEGEK